jgi:bacillithiol biosynthesis cysteine-adding enzyme BshC
MDFLDYRRLPAASGGYSELFLDYLYDYAKVREYYPQNFRSVDAVKSVCQELASHSRNRESVSSILRDQQAGFGCGAASLENASRLARPDTFAVVTGQQLGLFGGPLYTIYKALTAIHLAAKLNRTFPQQSFVPVFWLEGEDHDFQEINHAGFLDHENKLLTVRYLPGGVLPERNVGATGNLVYDETILSTLDETEGALGKTEFSPDLIAALRECYRPGATFLQAFASWIARLFGERGLVLVNPNDPRLKQHLAPVFVREIETFPRSSQLVISRSAGLEEKYHAQIKAKSLNLFMFHKGGRYLIEPRDTDFSLKGTRAFFSREEIARIAREEPELLSPNVILRPLCQDVLLPTAAYVAGPSEIAYFAQLQPVYEDLQVTEPVVYPRASISIVQSATARAMDRYNLEVGAFFGDLSRVTAAVVEQISEIQLEPLFGDTQQQIKDSLGELRFGLNEIDPTLLGALENTVGKIESQLNVLKEKALAAQKRRNETAVKQIERAASCLIPEGILQERQVNPLYYMNKLGPDFLSWLDARIDIEAYSHQFLIP